MSNNKILLTILTCSALILTLSLSYYFVIYIPNRNLKNDIKQETIREENWAQQRNAEATRFCLKKIEDIQKNINNDLPGILAACPYTGICTRVQAIENITGKKYSVYNDPTTPEAKNLFMQGCVNNYPVK